MYRNRIKAAMALRGVCVASMAQATGIPRHRLYRKLRGASEFRLSEMEAVAAYLGCDAGRLFFDAPQA